MTVRAFAATLAALLLGTGPGAGAQTVLQPFQGIPTVVGVVTLRCAADPKGGYVYSINAAAAVTHGKCQAGALPALARTGAARDVALFNGRDYSDAYFDEPAPSGAAGRVGIRFRTSGPPIVLDYGSLDTTPEIAYVTDDIVELRVPPAGQPAGSPWQCAVQFDWSLAKIVAIRPMTTGPLKMSAAECADRFKKVSARYDG